MWNLLLILDHCYNQVMGMLYTLLDVVEFNNKKFNSPGCDGSVD